MKYDSMNKKELIDKLGSLEKDLENFKKSSDSHISHKQYEEKIHESESWKKELEDTQKLLEESLHVYADLYDYAPTGYINLDASGVIKNINLTATDIFNTDKKFVIGIPFVNFIVKQDIPGFYDMLRKSKANGTFITREFMLQLKNNNLMPVEIRCMEIFDYNQHDHGFRIALLDISERKKSEKAARESESRFRIMADAAPVFIWMFNEQHELEYVNKQGLDFTGWDPENLTGVWNKSIHTKDFSSYNEKCNEAFKNLGHITAEFRLKRYDGRYRWIYINEVPRILSDGTFVGYIGSGVDISELKQYRDELEKSVKEKVLLLKEVHHRVKNNLQIIASMLNLQKVAPGEKSIDEILTSCQNRVYSIALLHEKLYREDSLSTTSYKEYLEKLINNLFLTYSNTLSRVSVSYDIQPLSININTVLLLGLILNELISNSLKHAFPDDTKGKINVSLKEVNHGDNLLLEVSDTGVGMPDDFDLESAESLGLMIVTSLSSQLDGKLNIENNHGTRFSILFRNTSDHSKMVRNYF